jgi:hypothetical protein
MQDDSQVNLGNSDGKVRDLLAAAIAQGFRMEKSKKAIKMFPPNKKHDIITMSCTPSDTNYYWQLRRELRKSGCILP